MDFLLRSLIHEMGWWHFTVIIRTKWDNVTKAELLLNSNYKAFRLFSSWVQGQCLNHFFVLSIYPWAAIQWAYRNVCWRRDWYFSQVLGSCQASIPTCEQHQPRHETYSGVSHKSWHCAGHIQLFPKDSRIMHGGFGGKPNNLVYHIYLDILCNFISEQRGL